MKPQSRHVIHVGINFITIPTPIVTQQSFLLFQQAIITNGLDFIRSDHPKNQIILIREEPSHLQVTVSSLDPQVGQLLIASSQPKGSLELFIQETEAVVNSFESVWPSKIRQLIKCDATVRDLRETTGEHAFQELWEKRLGQSSQSLSSFGRPIRGGGLRFVMDPLPEDEDPVQIEVKIESFLRDTTKIFVETQFNWLKPTTPGISFNPRVRLSSINTYIEDHIDVFLEGGNK